MNASTLFFIGAIENSLKIKIEMKWDQAQEVLEHIDGYNSFTGQLAKDILQAADKTLPKHPDRRDRTFDVSLGREGSMVMYVTRRFFTESDVTPDEDINTLTRYAKDHGLADEAHYEIKGYGPYFEETFRFWWD